MRVSTITYVQIYKLYSKNIVAICMTEVYLN